MSKFMPTYHLVSYEVVPCDKRGFLVQEAVTKLLVADFKAEKDAKEFIDQRNKAFEKLRNQS